MEEKMVEFNPIIEEKIDEKVCSNSIKDFLNKVLLCELKSSLGGRFNYSGELDFLINKYSEEFEDNKDEN